MSTTTSGSSNLPATPSTAGLAAALKQADASKPRTLVALDSPAMKFALALCGEVFPNTPVDVEVLNDPEDPERSWYCLNIQWPGEPRDCIARSSCWYDRFDAVHREVIADFTLSVIPV